MTKGNWRIAGTCAALTLMLGEVAASAQRFAPLTSGTLNGSPFAPPPALPDPSTVPMPALAFKPDGTEAKDFDKYYAFHRADTDFATAYADIVECDGYARGLQSGIAYGQAPYPYAGTMAGAAGSIIGNLMVAAIFGSAEKRRMRRTNMRTCMNFKGYTRHGLPKSLWDNFNFEEGIGSVSEEKRQRYLQQQAMVASSGKLQGSDLGL